MELSTVKGHGFKVGETVEYYGMASDAFPPAEEPTLCVLTKQGTRYVLTYAGEYGQHEWTFGPAAKIWAAKVNTVTVAPVAQGQTVHNLETDEVFTVTEVTPGTVSLRKIGTWRDGVTMPARDVANMISDGTMVIIGNPGDVREDANPITSHDFSNHSRRPMECRLCSQPAEVHATTTDEGSSRAMWTKARKEAGMSTTSAPVPADKPSANPWGPCGPCDGTDAPMARKAHPCGLVNKPATTEYVINEGDTVYRERDGHTGIVTTVTNRGDLVVLFNDGGERHGTPIELLNAGYGVIPAAEVAEGFAAAESAIWAGTGTLVKPSIRTCLNRRKRKATRRNRARVGGGF